MIENSSTGKDGTKRPQKTVWIKLTSRSHDENGLKIRAKANMRMNSPLLIWVCIMDVGGNPITMLSLMLLAPCAPLWPTDIQDVGG